MAGPLPSRKFPLANLCSNYIALNALVYTTRTYTNICFDCVTPLAGSETWVILRLHRDRQNQVPQAAAAEQWSSPGSGPDNGALLDYSEYVSFSRHFTDTIPGMFPEGVWCSGWI